MASSNNRTSALVSSHVPSFVREEHETFVKFLEYYYKFLEQDGQQLYVAKNLNRYEDIDIITRDVLEDTLAGSAHLLREESDYHAFLQKLYDNYIAFLPNYILADKTLITKHAKDFYRSTGTEKSVRFLIRALFNKETTFYYPQVDILKASDGKWFVEKSLKVTDVRVNNVANNLAVNNFKNHLIVGADTNSYATVETVETYYESGSLVTELKLSNIGRSFIDGETIFTYYTEEGVEKRLSANLFSGIINFVQIKNGGSGYVVGTSVPIVSASGSGGQVIINKTTTGSLVVIGVSKSGAGFRPNDSLTITGGGGTGANAKVFLINNDETYHPNSYNVVSSTIDLEANTAINNTVYSNLVSSISDPANAWVSNSMSAWTYANCGPVVQCLVTSGGSGFSELPSLDISANTRIRAMGILGRMEIIDGGHDYVIGDTIEFINPYGSYGSGAAAEVTDVDINGAITEVKFTPISGQITGGSGYDQHVLPIANVVTTTGVGANVMVTATIGDGEALSQSVSDIGTITELRLVSGGSGYLTAPTLDLTGLGDGTAEAIATIVSGVYTYPGRYVNDDGHISSFNFLEDRDYYQKFSYVTQTPVPTTHYRKALNELIHPAGMKFFGEYPVVDDTSFNYATNASVDYAETVSNTQFLLTNYLVEGYNVATYNVSVLRATYVPGQWEGTYTFNSANQSGTFAAQNTDIVINIVGHGYSTNDSIYFSFIDNTTANIVNAIYVAANANAHYITITNPNNVPDLKTGNVRIWNPYITLYAPSHGQVTGNTVYLVFSNSDTSLHNTIYQVEATVSGNSNLFRVFHKDTSNGTSTTGNVSIYTDTVTVVTMFANGHSFSEGDQAYIRFRSGDTSNIANGHYVVTGVANANSLNITVPHNIRWAGDAYLNMKQVTLNLANHLANGSSNVYLAFISGDQGNSVNTIYTYQVVDANNFYINTAKSLTSNGRVRVYYSNVVYDNITFTRAGHNFSLGESLWVEFDTTQGIAEGNFLIKSIYDSATYNISYNGHYYYSSNTIHYTGIRVTSGIVMESTAMVAKYK